MAGNFILGFNDNCRNIKFFGHIEGQALVDHVISSLLVTSGDICQIRCYFVHDCVSFNLGISETGDLYICELNNSTDQAFLQREKYTYHETQNSCSSRPCLNNGKCQHGFTAKTFRCLCPAGFEGELCEKDIDECTAGTHNCSENAWCSNTVGSFNCTCCGGYVGDGVNCTAYCGILFDFENGLSCWTLTGNAFNNQPTYGDNSLVRGKGPANHKGNWWIGGFENRPSPSHQAGADQSDVPQGTMTSHYFWINGNSLRFLIGGSCSVNEIRAELIVDGNVVFRETGDCSESMTEKSWNVSGFVGRMAQLSLVDNSSGHWGHINFDHLICQ